MKRETIDVSEERKILTNMILSTEFLSEISIIVRENLFKSGYARIVAGWVMDYWTQYREAPGRNIQDIYSAKIQSIPDEDELEMVGEFLAKLSRDAEDYKLQNLDYSARQAEQFFKLRSLERLSSQLNGLVKEKDPLKAEQLIANYSRIERPLGESIDMFRDKGRVISAFLNEDEFLFEFSGALGKVLGPFVRGDLYAWQGFTGRGKTWWELYSAEVAASFGCKVLFVELEMPWEQIVRRTWQGLTASPKRDKEILLPRFEKPEGSTFFEVEGSLEFRKAVDTSKIDLKQQKFRRMFRGGEIRIESLSSASVTDLIAHLDNMYYFDNFEPDLLIVDSADLLSPEIKDEHRHKLNNIWQGLRMRIAKERNIAVMTATHSSKEGGKKDADEFTASEDNRKLNHVAKMMTINRTKAEAKRGIVRISQTKERDDSAFYEQAVVLQCLDIGRPYIDSRLKSEVILSFDEEEG